MLCMELCSSSGMLTVESLAAFCITFPRVSTCSSMGNFGTAQNADGTWWFFVFVEISMS